MGGIVIILVLIVISYITSYRLTRNYFRYKTKQVGTKFYPMMKNRNTLWMWEHYVGTFWEVYPKQNSVNSCHSDRYTSYVFNTLEESESFIEKKIANEPRVTNHK